MPTKSKSLPITERADSPTLQEVDPIPLTTPGEFLREEFLEPMGISAYRLAKAIGVPQPYISKVIHGGGISPELGVLLDRYFGLSNGWWSRYQANYNARVARRKLADHIARVEPYRADPASADVFIAP